MFLCLLVLLLIIVGIRELGLKRVVSFLALWLALLAGFMYLNVAPYLFSIVDVLFCIALLLATFGRDIRIR